MPASCCVKGCCNKHGRDGTSFHRIPAVVKHQGPVTEEKSVRRRNAWLGSINRVETSNTAYWFVCSSHLLNGKPSALYDETNPDWVPTVNMGHSKRKAVDPGRYQRKVNRVSKAKDLDAAAVLVSIGQNTLRENEFNDENKENRVEIESQTDPSDGDAYLHPVTTDNDTEHVETDTNKECQTDMLGTDISSLRRHNQRLLTDNINLKKKSTGSLYSKETFEGDNDKVKFYTGLPNFVILMAVFNFISKDLPSHGRNVIPPFEQLILVLMRLRLNLSIVDLSYRFAVSRSTISSVFLRVLDLLYVKLKPLIYWPSREDLRKTMPMCFRTHFGTKVAIIIDCFEIFIDRPSNLMARNQTFSYYKHHNTVKFLIGICPQGVVSYLSKGWGGRTSDKYLTENCDILNKLLPGDIVLADRGFDIAESVGMMCAQVHIPAFTRGKKQLSPLDVEKTRRLANVRIHVERVIGEIRQKYRMLESTLPIDYMISKNGLVPTVDKLVTVSCALVNMCDSVVPFD